MVYDNLFKNSLYLVEKLPFLIDILNSLEVYVGPWGNPARSFDPRWLAPWPVPFPGKGGNLDNVAGIGLQPTYVETGDVTRVGIEPQGHWIVLRILKVKANWISIANALLEKRGGRYVKVLVSGLTHRIFWLHVYLVAAYDSVSVSVGRRIPHNLHWARVDGRCMHILRLPGDLKKESEED